MLYKETSNADGLTILTSPLLDSLKSQLGSLQSQLTSYQQQSAQYQQYWDSRHNCGGILSGPCNTWLDKRNAANANIANINAQIESIKSQIDKELSNLKAQNDAAISNKQKTDSTLAKIQADQSTSSSALSNKKLWIIIGGTALVLIAIGILIYLKHFKGKGK
jgi:multidrug efflux pump subunit AcrA (membrane-fusion protein)